MKPGILIAIPGFGKLELRAIVSDSRGGRITHGVERRLIHLSELVDIHILTAGTFGTAERELQDMPVSIHRLPGEEQDDRLLQKAVKEAGGLAIAVDNGEGCAIETLQNANLFIVGAENALDLLIEAKRLKATGRGYLSQVHTQ